MFQTRQELSTNDVFHTHALFLLERFWCALCKHDSASELLDTANQSWHDSWTVHKWWGWISDSKDRWGELRLETSVSIPAHKLIHWRVCAKWRKSVRVCLKAFTDMKKYSRALVSVFTQGLFTVSRLLPKWLRPKRIKLSPACSSFL